MAKKKKKNETEVIGITGIDGKILDTSKMQVIGRMDDKGNITPFIQQQQEIAPVKETKSTWLKKGVLNDSGYAIQNPLDAINRINAGILMTGVDALGQFSKGFLGSAESVTDIAKTTTADVLDFFGADNKAKKLRKSAENQWGVNKELDQALASNNGMGIDDMSFLGEKGKTVPQGLGTTAFSMASGSILGGAGGMALLGLSAAGNAEQEAIKEMKAYQDVNGLSDKEIYKQAKLYGLISGTIEAGTEMFFGGLSQGSKLLGIGTGVFDSADDAVINALTKKINNKLVKTFTQAGLKASSEGIEEVLSGLGNAWAKKLTYMKQEDINKLIEDENLLDSFLSGTFSAALSQSPSVVRNVTTTENGKVRLQTNEEIRDFITNLNQQEQQVVEREVENRLGQEEKVTKKRRAEIQKQVIEDLDRGYINANTIRDVLGDNYNAERDVRLNESFNEEARRTQAYQNDLSKYDEKQQTTIQRAIDSGLLNNSNKTHDFVDLIAKLSADKGIEFDFTNNENIKNSGFAIDGKQVNGFIQDGKVTLNLESNQALNKTVGHEITHVLEGTELYNSLQDSLKSFIGEREWNNRISELEKTYKNVKGANIENELTSDLVGEYVFNDESFVKSLSTRNPNLFQKIFDEIKYMVKIATAGSKEARDLEKVKRAFEKAYRETSKTQQGTQYSIKDNNNRELSEQQQEYFKDSKVRDDEGNLMVMYHGTPRGTTTEFRAGTYFTNNKQYADRYQNLGASSISTKSVIDNPKTYEVYLDIKNPFDTKNNPEARRIFEEEFFRKWGNGTPLTDRGYPDWVEGVDLQEFIETEHPEFDGFIVDEGGEGGYGQPVVDRGLSYITMSPSQVKNVDNTNPTSNPDIRYSLSDNGEMVDNSTGEKVTLETSDTGTTGTLMAIHNLGEEKFNGVMDLGGFPYPSIAITKPSTISHEGYGDASAIFSKDTIDPELNNRNKVYSRDAYTPRFPHLEYKIDSNVVKNIRNVIGDYDYRNVQPGDSYISDANNILNDLEDNINNRGLDKTLKDIKDNVAMKYVYLKNTNPSFQVETRNENYSSKYTNETLQRFLDNYNGEFDYNNISSSDVDNYLDNMVNAYREQLIEKFSEIEGIDEATINELVDKNLTNFRERFADKDNFLLAAHKLQKSGANNQVLDTVATKEKINNTINQEEYEKWVDDLFKNIIEKRGIRNNKEYYTSTGNRRTFEQLHDEYNLENVVKILDALDDTGSEGEMFTGISEIAGNASIRFNSIEDIKANENLLTTVGSEEYSNMLEDISNRLHDIQSAIIERGHNNSDNYFIAMDNLAQAVADTARLYGEGKKVDANRVLKEIKEYGFNPTLEEAQQIYDMFSELRQLPTQYFEAKPKRAVGFDELETMVIPNNWSQETKQRMTDRGIKYVEYNPEIEGDRQRVINQFDDLKFSLSQDNIAPTSGWNVRSEDVRLQSAFKDAIAPIQEQVQQLTDTITRLEDRIAPLNEQEADELYQETQRGFENEVAPMRENLTPEENQRLDMLELLERNNMMNEERQYEKEQLENKANPINPDEEISPSESLNEIRDIDEVSSPKVKAYQYEHPEVKPYFQEEARKLLSDLDNSYKGFREGRESTKNGEGFNWEWSGAKRFTSPQIADMLEGGLGTKYQYDDIRKGLNAIIEDHGAENIAVAKRIEFILDDNLRNGYTDWQTGMEIPPNSDYLNMLAEQAWDNYYDDVNSQYPLEEVPQYATEDEETDFSDVKIDKDLQDMTVDDIDVSPFLEGLVKADERQKARQEMDKKVVNRNEYTPKKKGIIGRAIDLYKSITNEFAVVDKFAKDVKNPTITHKIDTWNNSVPLAQTNITTAQTDINGKAIGRSWNSIWEEANKLGIAEKLDEYVKHWSNIDRGKRGKGALDYSAKESYKKAQEIKSQYPDVHRLAKDIWQFSRNARHNLRDAGTISQQVSDILGRTNPHYIPFVSDNISNYFTETGELKPRRTIKRAKGGAELEGLLSSEEAMKSYVYSQFAETTGNDAFLEIVKSSPNQFVFGGDDRTSYVNQDHLSVDKDGYYLTAYENGEPISAQISKEMYDALSRKTKHNVDDFIKKYESVLKPLEKFGNLRRKMLTELSPSFLLKNPGKDFQEAVINSKYTKDMIANYMNPETWIELAKGTGEADIFRNNYGSGLVMGQYDIDISEIDPKSKNFNFLKKLGNANEYMELITRYAEFKASRQNGASIQEAMYNAREVTTNFSRGNPIIKAFNKYGMTFLNSSVQGFDKFIRNFSGENGAKGIVNSLAKAAIFGIAPAVFNELVFGSGDDKDEEYEALPDYIKDNYYIIKTGNGNFIRIPKGRLFSVFGSAARRTIEAMEGEENAFEGFLENAQQQIGINNPEENNIFAPLLQAMGGRKLDSGQTAGSAWYGGDIIPSRLQKERPEDQYDASIDKFSIWLGQKTGISPYKINYVLDQYTGGIGDLALPMITDEANSDGSILAPIKDQFTADSTTDNKYVSEFYDTKGKLYTGSKATDEDILKNMYMSDISMTMGKLYAERREIQASDLPKKEKYQKSQEIKKEINRLAKVGLDGYENIELTGNYAVINDDMGCYKNANGKWKPIPQDDIIFTESQGLTDKEMSDYYGLKNDIYTINKEYEDESLNASEEEKKALNKQKKNEIIDTIKSSNLDDNTKAYIYSKKYGDKKIQSFVNSGMDVDSYLDYKQQDFTADKDKDGKSISGSKKRKVFDYINSMNIPYEQKLILAKSEYKKFNQNNYDIINYIENSGMSYDDRMELYKNLGFKVDGNNISW